MFKSFHQQQLAFDLLKRQARIAIIHKETGIPKQPLRHAYREMHGQSAQSGAMKYSTHGLTRNLKQFKETTLFAMCFKAVAVRCQDTFIRKTIHAFDLYKRFYPASQLDFSNCWVVAKDLSDLKIRVTQCPHCRSAVLLNAREDGVDRCVICKTKVYD